MKRKPIVLISLVLGLGVLSGLTWAGVTRAADVRASTSPTVAAQETVNGTLYAAGKDIVVAGTVKGDVFCAGSDIEITGVVEGDVMCAGRTLKIGGKVLGDVRVAGGDVTISAQVTGSVTLAGNKAQFTSEATVGRDVVLGGREVQLNGTIARDILGVAGTVTVRGAVGRNFEAEADRLTLAEAAKVGGNLTYESPEQAVIANGASIAGKTTYHEAPQSTQLDANAIRLWVAGYWFAAMLVMGVVVIAAAPRWIDKVGSGVRTRVISAFAHGAIVFVATPVVAALLFMSIVGLPLGIILMCLWFAAMFSSLTFAAYALGWIVVEKLAWPSRAQRLASLFIGALLITLLGLIPFVGPIITFAAILLGLGGLAKAVDGHIRPKVTSKAKA